MRSHMDVKIRFSRKRSWALFTLEWPFLNCSAFNTTQNNNSILIFHLVSLNVSVSPAGIFSIGEMSSILEHFVQISVSASTQFKYEGSISNFRTFENGFPSCIKHFDSTFAAIFCATKLGNHMVQNADIEQNSTY